MRWGWYDVFDNAINDSIRMAVGVKSEGAVSIHKELSR